MRPTGHPSEYSVSHCEGCGLTRSDTFLSSVGLSLVIMLVSMVMFGLFVRRCRRKRVEYTELLSEGEVN